VDCQNYGERRAPSSVVPPVTGAEHPAPVDGRTARRDRNRDAVLDAVLDMFAEGRFEPGAAEVAARSGVSPRSVFRYFEDRDALVRAAMARHLERVAPLIDVPDPGEGPLDERIERLVAHRLRLYAAVAATARAAEVRAYTAAVIRDQLDRARRRSGAEVEAMFAPEMAGRPEAERRAVLAAVDTLLQFSGLEHLHVRSGLDLDTVHDVLVRAVGALLADPSA